MTPSQRVATEGKRLLLSDEEVRTLVGRVLGLTGPASRSQVTTDEQADRIVPDLYNYARAFPFVVEVIDTDGSMCDRAVHPDAAACRAFCANVEARGARWRMTRR